MFDNMNDTNGGGGGGGGEVREWKGVKKMWRIRRRI